MGAFEIIEDKIPVNIYQNLRMESGLSVKTTAASEIGQRILYIQL